MKILFSIESYFKDILLLEILNMLETFINIVIILLARALKVSANLSLTT
jgi:hypothetical protein